MALECAIQQDERQSDGARVCCSACPSVLGAALQRNTPAATPTPTPTYTHTLCRATRLLLCVANNACPARPVPCPVLASMHWSGCCPLSPIRPADQASGLNSREHLHFAPLARTVYIQQDRGCTLLCACISGGSSTTRRFSDSLPGTPPGHESRPARQLRSRAAGLVESRTARQLPDCLALEMHCPTCLPPSALLSIQRISPRQQGVSRLSRAAAPAMRYPRASPAAAPASSRYAILACSCFLAYCCFCFLIGEQPTRPSPACKSTSGPRSTDPRSTTNLGCVLRLNRERRRSRKAPGPPSWAPPQRAATTDRDGMSQAGPALRRPAAPDWQQPRLQRRRHGPD